MVVDAPDAGETVIIGKTLMAVLTYDDKQTAEAHQRLLDLAALQGVCEGIRQGLEEASNGRVRPVREFFADFKARNGISG